MKNAIRKLHEAIAYPDNVPSDGDSSFIFRVDGGSVQARLFDGKLILSRVIDRQENDLPRLAAYATGRLLKEEAVLAWDERSNAVILWQDCSESANSLELKNFFETFLNSCDWWLERAADMNAPIPTFPDIVIRP